MKENTPAHAD